jgi:hypothetical protein
MVEDGRNVGRIYEDRHSKPETAVVLVDQRLRQSHARRMPTLWCGFPVRILTIRPICASMRSWRSGNGERSKLTQALSRCDSQKEFFRSVTYVTDEEAIQGA